MDQRTLIVGAYAVAVVGFLATAAWAFRRRGAARAVRLWLGGAALFGAAWAAFQGGLSAGAVSLLPPGITAHLPHYAAVGAAFVLDRLSRRVLPGAAGRSWPYWVAAAWAAGLIVLDLGLFTPGPVLFNGSGWQIEAAGFVAAGLAVLWAGLMAGSVRRVLRTYRRTTQPLHRNRLAYWAMAAAMLTASGGLVWIDLVWAGTLALAGALGLVGLALLENRLPDARRAVYQGWGTLLAAIVAIGLYSLLLVGFGLAAQGLAGVWLPVAAAGAALLLVVAANPLVGWLSRRIRAWRSDRSYQPRRIVGEYSLSISNILELDRLAEVALSLLREVFGVERAALYVVEIKHEADDNLIRLTLTGSLTRETPAAGSIPTDSPLAQYLRAELAPVTQYDLDVDPAFAALTRAERVWLDQLNMDVFVPVYANREWIGLFALGPKRSRHRYFSEDLELLSTLADQTAVALQNARLVTDLVRLNTDLQSAYTALNTANQRLGQLERAKSDFISIISHELRTPLAILFGYAQILADELGQHGHGEHMQLVDGMTTGVTRLKEIIENMLDMARIDSRALQLQAQPVHIEHLVQKLVWQLQWALNERNLTLQSYGLSNLPAVEGDADALYKALHHLVANAVKYTPNGGRITISAQSNGKADNPAVEVVVSDTGIGIDPRFLELIFDKFYQTGEVAQHSSGNTKFKGGGPGLGLAIARGIAEAHGGSLTAQSAGYDEERLPGSKFILVLPLRQTHMQTPPV